MNKYLIVLLLTLNSTNISFGQEFIPYYGNIVNNCSYDTILTNLQMFEGAGIKELGSFSLTRTKNWIIDKYSSYGYTDIVEDPFDYYGVITSNIIITKTGSVYPDKYVIIDGHYDTRDGVGANDNGSGTVSILEIARLLKDVNTEYSIKFIHFSAEEVGLVGSWHYVENTVIPQNLDIKLVFNIDGIGGVNGMVNNTISCERDESSPPSSNNEASAIITNELANCVRLYSSLATEISNAYASDYMTFEYNNEIITGLYEKNISPYYHSSDDVISNLDVNYIHEVTKAATGAALHFSAAFDGTTRVIDDNFLDNIAVYPNPANDNVSINLGETITDIKLTLRNSIGQLLLNKSFEPSNHTNINIEDHPAGLYFLLLETPFGESKSIKIFKE
jgi:Zn-dependent M28 family amino/carboxypeptidase